VRAHQILTRLRGGLIVSVQAEAGSPLNEPATIAMLARVAVRNGAAGIRAEGAARLGAVRRAIDETPLIGLVKRAYPGYGPYITATARELAEVAAARCDIVAFDATGRPRPDGASVAATIAAIQSRGAVAMADCADADDIRRARDAGADIVATTLCGYTEATHGAALPALDLVRFAAATGAFVVCEGGVGTPADLAAAFAAGANAVVVGTAITNVDVLVRRFASELPNRE